MTIKRDYKTKDCAVYDILGIRVDGRKEILGLWIQESESKHSWMQIFDELKSRGVQEVGFISMDGVSDLEEGARAIFPQDGRSTLYCPSGSQLPKIRADSQLRAFHGSAEKDLRYVELQSLSCRVRAFLSTLGKISGRDCRLETIFCLRRATL